jgi:hypothetical protein
MPIARQTGIRDCASRISVTKLNARRTAAPQQFRAKKLDSPLRLANNHYGGQSPPAWMPFSQVMDDRDVTPPAFCTSSVPPTGLAVSSRLGIVP